MAAVMGQDAGIAYRYGNDPAATPPAAVTATMYEYPHTQSANTHAIWEFGRRQMPDVVSNQAGAGNYSTQQMGVAFVSDSQGRYPGIINLQALGHEFGTEEFSPQQSWTTWVAGDGGYTDPSMRKTANLAMIGSARPVAVGQGKGRYDHNRSRLVAYDNGLIGNVGSNTNTNSAWCQLKAGLVPTGVAMSDCSEFGFVSYWDTVAIRGGVAVIALAGIPEGATWNVPSSFYDNWGEWMATYPGLPNWGDIGLMKVLGYVDLGADMVAPTEIAVTTGFDQFNLPWHFQYDNTPLTSNFTKFQAGGSLNGAISKGGCLTVISKSEKKLAFLDLKPLFMAFFNQYFGSASSCAAAATPGAADSAWPFVFTVSPAQTPTIIQKLTLTQKPTAVEMTAFGTFPGAWVATQDGTLSFYKVGTYAPGNSVQSPTSAQIGLVSSIVVGRNITRLGVSKNEPQASLTGESVSRQIMACSRMDKRIDWVRISASGSAPAVIRTLKHNLLLDPIAVDDAEDYATQSCVCTVLDYNGKTVRTYRYGPVIYNETGTAPDGQAWPCQGSGCPVIDAGGIDYGGSFVLPGKPFQLATANTP